MLPDLQGVQMGNDFKIPHSNLFLLLLLPWGTIMEKKVKAQTQIPKKDHTLFKDSLHKSYKK